MDIFAYVEIFESLTHQLLSKEYLLLTVLKQLPSFASTLLSFLNISSKEYLLLTVLKQLPSFASTLLSFLNISV